MGQYLRTVVGPGRSKEGVSLTDDELTNGVEMAPSDASVLGERVVREFGVRRRREPHTAFPHHAWEHHLSESAGSEGYRCRLDQLRDRLGREQLGGVHFHEVVLAAGDLRSIARPALRVERGNHWAMKGKDVLGVAFGPRDQMVVIQGQVPRNGPAQWSGTLVVDEVGLRVDVASGVAAVTVPG